MGGKMSGNYSLYFRVGQSFAKRNLYCVLIKYCRLCNLSHSISRWNVAPSRKNSNVDLSLTRRTIDPNLDKSQVV